MGRSFRVLCSPSEAELKTFKINHVSSGSSVGISNGSSRHDIVWYTFRTQKHAKVHPARLETMCCDENKKHDPADASHLGHCHECVNVLSSIHVFIAWWKSCWPRLLVDKSLTSSHLILVSDQVCPKFVSKLIQRQNPVQHISRYRSGACRDNDNGVSYVTNFGNTWSDTIELIWCRWSATLSWHRVRRQKVEDHTLWQDFTYLDQIPFL